MSENLKKLKLEISDNKLTTDKIRLKGLVDDYVKNDSECQDDCYKKILLTIEYGFLMDYLSNSQIPTRYIELLKNQNYSNSEIQSILIYCDYLAGNCTYDELMNVISSSTSSKKFSPFSFLKSSKASIKKIEINALKLMRGDEVVIKWGIFNYKKIVLVIDNVPVDVTNETSYKFSPMETTSFYFLVENINNNEKIKSKEFKVTILDTIALSFEPKRKFSIQSLPVKLSWKCKNATHISIYSNIGDKMTNLNNVGEVEVFPSKDCIYTIIAKHDLQTIEKKAYLYVKELPSLTNLKIPHIPNLVPNFSFSSVNSKMEEANCIPNLNTVKSIEQVTKDHSSMFKLIHNSIDGKNIIEKINKYIYDKKNTK